ncbi:hypothetical protein CDL15_Pgr002730 [Punica granatum]|uniref:Uncharacterized protein n=1 Tax=Punica granatum TaxID=22663 RepID=A0A218X0W1_PUNGR|nr:hypothetical protein CDL15_Pgr002730 [Punica granatum]
MSSCSPRFPRYRVQSSPFIIHMMGNCLRSNRVRADRDREEADNAVHGEAEKRQVVRVHGAGEDEYGSGGYFGKNALRIGVMVTRYGSSRITDCCHRENSQSQSDLSSSKLLASSLVSRGRFSSAATEIGSQLWKAFRSMKIFQNSYINLRHQSHIMLAWH